jgi:hypothetical protein
VSKNNNSIIKGTIFLLLGILIIYAMITLHIKDIFIYLGFIVIGFGIYSIVISFLKNRTIKEHNSNKSLKRLLENNFQGKSNILNKVPIHDEKSSKMKRSRVHKFSKPQVINKSIGKFKYSNSKPDLLNNSKPRKFKPHKQASKPFIFTPNYERPSNITRKPVKKHLKSSKRYKLSKIKPTISINQLSKTLGLEKESSELNKLKRTLKDDNPNSNSSTINNHYPDSPTKIMSTLNRPTAKKNIIKCSKSKNSGLNESIDLNNRAINLNNEKFPKYNDSINEEILKNMIKYDLKNKNNNQNFIDKLDEIHIFCEDKSLKFSETLERLSKKAKKEIFIEIPSLKSLSNEVLLILNYLGARIIIEKFDVKDISYSFIISSLLENKNISIKIIDSVDSIIVVVDNDYALVLSELVSSGIGVGAVFTEEKEVNSIKDTFELLWEISKEL